MEKTYFSEWTESACRQYIDSQAIFSALASTERELVQFKGSMRWKRVSGRDYLIRLSAAGSQHGLGPRSADTDALYESFWLKKRALEVRRKSLHQQLAQAQRLNKAVFVGRMANPVPRLLAALERMGCAGSFLVVGTQAIHAYETAAAVRFELDGLDWVDRKASLQLLSMPPSTSRHLGASGLVDALRTANTRLSPDAQNPVRLLDGAGFAVEVMDGLATDGEAGVWALQARRALEQSGARAFEQMVVGRSGAMTLMRTFSPMDFVEVKRRLSRMPGRLPELASGDRLQAQLVERVWQEALRYLPQFRVGS